MEADEIGTLVVTPFPPYRETTLLLRFETGADHSGDGDFPLRSLFPACSGPSSLSRLQPVLAEVSRARTEDSITSDNRWLHSLSAVEAAHEVTAATEYKKQMAFLL
jgi:hypothetical protein